MTGISHPGLAAEPFLNWRDDHPVDGLRTLVERALDTVEAVRSQSDLPVPAGGPDGAHSFAAVSLAEPLLPEVGQGPLAALDSLTEPYVRWSVDVNHPNTVARMQCPPTAVAIAADLVTTVLNQSMHAWEAGPFALELERRLIAELAELVGYGSTAGGTVTAGGSISNIMAMLVARDNVYQRRFGSTAFESGIGSRPCHPVVLCTDTSHFSMDRGAGISGIGGSAILRVPTDRQGRMLPEHADRILRTLEPDQVPVLLFACVGSTDFGWVDPLPELAEIAREHGVWLHADAAYGGGALFSDRLRPLLQGLAAADSITLDLHKFGWTPASSGIFLTRDAASLGYLGSQRTSLNAPDDVEAGFIGRYGSSIQATRRCDALKIAVTLRAYGRQGIAAMVDACHDLALHAAVRVQAEADLELAAEPVLSTVLLRYLPSHDQDLDEFNSALRRTMMTDGSAMLARVFLPDEEGVKRVYLKLMLLNPATRPAELDELIDIILATGRRLDDEAGA